MKRLILFIFGLGLFISSCNDHLKIEKNDLTQGVADSQMVGSWKITAVVSDVPYDWDNDGDAEKDIYANWTGCQRDNLFTFTGDTATGAFKKGTFKINCSVTKPGTWQIITAHYLVYIPDGLTQETEEFIPGTMTANQFQTLLKVSLPSGTPANITKTWIRQ